MSDLTSTPEAEAPGTNSSRATGEADSTQAERVSLPGLQGAELNPTRADTGPTIDVPDEPDYVTFVGVDLNEKYRIIRPIGKGGMGTIFLAEHIGIGKRVAIKLLGSKFSGNDAIIRRFEKEARAAARVRHKNIVEIYDCDRTPEGLPFFAMELLNGIDIRRMLKKDGPIAWPRALHLMKQICAALEAAHKSGIVHRDMKPGNVFVVEDAEEPDFVKVVDFGIAKVLDNDEDQELTHTGMVMGTAHYMSPEQARSEPLDHRADVYSAGVILFQMLTGKLPYEGKGFMGTLSLHLTESIPSIRSVAVSEGIDLPLVLEPVIQKVLAKDPDARYQSAAEFAEALDELGVNPKVSLTQTMTLHAAEIRKNIRPTWIAAAVAGIAVLLTVGLYMALTRDDKPQPAPPVVVAAPQPEPQPEPEP
ncbi:MAG: serine/threonine protein kinase, partial [Myxococcales bacterium]|nr:serine/threonine protein kinase [Myxococcales bacterium]